VQDLGGSRISPSYGKRSHNIATQLGAAGKVGQGECSNQSLCAK
jgi:hypothetical protein